MALRSNQPDSAHKYIRIKLTCPVILPVTPEEGMTWGRWGGNEGHRKWDLDLDLAVGTLPGRPGSFGRENSASWLECQGFQWAVAQSGGPGSPASRGAAAGPGVRDQQAAETRRSAQGNQVNGRVPAARNICPVDADLGGPQKREGIGWHRIRAKTCLKGTVG